MGNEGQRVHLVAVEQQVYLHQVGGAVLVQLVIQGGVAPGLGLEGVEEVVDDLVEGHQISDFHQVSVQVLHILILPPAVLAQGHDAAHVVRRRDDGHIGVGLHGLLDGAGVGVVVGIVHPHKTAVRFRHFIYDRG